MARKKKLDQPEKGVGGPDVPGAIDQQVMTDDTITIEDVKQFILDAKKRQEDYKLIADRSWNEIEKRNRWGKLHGGQDLERSKRWTKFPLWWSCWKIRQPITLARLPQPVLKDSQGDDPYGRTACILGERLVKGINKTFNAFDEYSSSNDDFLVTNLGWGRWCYRSVENLEEEKIRLQIVQPPPQIQPQQQQEPPQMEGAEQPQEAPAQEMQEMPPAPPIFLTPDGQQVDESQVQKDDLGPYLATGQLVNIENEEVYFEAGNYSGLLVDPDVTKWSKVTRIAFEYPYDYREFKEKFGQKGLDKLVKTDIQEHKTGKKPIVVYEYHDAVLKEVRWFAENSEDFFQPINLEAADVQNLKEQGQPADGTYNNDPLYELSNFFPCTEPLVINQSTRSFWPTPEYFQVQDIIEDISSIVARMMQLTKAVRIRFLFDSSVKQLAPLIQENWAFGEGTGIGIPNLEQTLMNGKGDLSMLVAYFPIDELMKGLQNMYVAFNQRLDMFYNITGFSDLLRGQVSDQASDKTYRGLQLEGKFALNRMEPYQRKIQEWIKNNYYLGMELALKMFSPETIDDYIVPQTLDPEDKQRYEISLELLKNNRRGRFHFDFETDSTISINQEWKREQAINTANAITKMLESTAKTAQDMPALAPAELRIAKHVIGELTDGKLFMDEVIDAIQKTIDDVSKPKAPEPNIELEKLKLDTRKQDFVESKAMTDDRLEQLTLEMKNGLEGAKMAQADRMAVIEGQIEQFKIAQEAALEQAKLSSDNEQFRANLQKEYEKISTDISIAQQELSLKRDELLVEIRKIADKKEVDQFDAMITARVVGFEEKLATAQHLLETQFKKLDEQEKWLTEARLQQESHRDLVSHKLESMDKIMEIALKKKELAAPIETPATKTPEPSTKKRKTVTNVVRDKDGQIAKLINEES